MLLTDNMVSFFFAQPVVPARCGSEAMPNLTLCQSWDAPKITNFILRSVPLAQLPQGLQLLSRWRVVERTSRESSAPGMYVASRNNVLEPVRHIHHAFYPALHTAQYKAVATLGSDKFPTPAAAAWLLSQVVSRCVISRGMIPEPCIQYSAPNHEPEARAPKTYRVDRL